jgi:hypothetical protein
MQISCSNQDPKIVCCLCSTVDAYLSRVDQKVDLLLEKVNANVRDGPAINSLQSISAADTTTNPLFEAPGSPKQFVAVAGTATWRQRVSAAAQGARARAGTRRSQIVAAAVCATVLGLLALVLALALRWNRPPTFLVSQAIPLAIPSGVASSGAIMIDVHLAIDHAAQVLSPPVPVRRLPTIAEFQSFGVQPVQNVHPFVKDGQHFLSTLC